MDWQKTQQQFRQMDAASVRIGPVELLLYMKLQTKLHKGLSYDSKRKT
jgi:hypothetical protein